MIRKHPPGPRNILEPIGLTARHLFNLWLRPLEFVAQLNRKYGPVAFFRAFHLRMYVVSAPNLIHQVLVTQKIAFRKIDRQMRAVSQLTGNGILTSDGSFWLRQRRLVQQAFSPQKLNGYADGMVEQTELLLDRWDALGKKPIVDVSLEMMWLTVRVTTRVFFGEQPRQRVEVLAKANLSISEAFSREMFSIFRFPDWLPLPGKKAKRQGIEAYNNEVSALIRERRESGGQTDDLLSAVLNAVDEEGDKTGMTDQQARDELLTIYIASHHTTSVALAWTFYLLAKHPEVEQRIVEEVEKTVGNRQLRSSDLPNLKYTEMVIKESLRLHPPAYALFAREALEDVFLGDHWIEKGGWVYIYPYVVHRDPNNFEHPEKFDPERFSLERIGTIKPNTYIPFGMGPHVCIGSRFAMIEFMLAVPTILRRYTMEIQPGHEYARSLPLLANHIKGGLPVRLRRRESCSTPIEMSPDSAALHVPPQTV
ncbi:MAG: cytochrome P450 [Planctomycetes bacterium]|nr:cytochrome P450 [Planctomycetota bacterium]